jgi:hypothetical protein
MNRFKARVRHVFNWSVAQGYRDDTPFKQHGVNVVRLNGAAETVRARRLQPGEEERLIAAATSSPSGPVRNISRTLLGHANITHDVPLLAIDDRTLKRALTLVEEHQQRQDARSISGKAARSLEKVPHWCHRAATLRESLTQRVAPLTRNSRCINEFRQSIYKHDNRPTDSRICCSPVTVRTTSTLQLIDCE